MTDNNDTIEIKLSDRAPVAIAKGDWPVVAEASWHEGEHESQANRKCWIKVREHRDGRRVAYGQYITLFRGERNKHAGFVVPASQLNEMRDAGDGGPLVTSGPDEEETVRAIRRVAGVLGMPDLGDECIGDLPAEELT